MLDPSTGGRRQSAFLLILECHAHSKYNQEQTNSSFRKAYASQAQAGVRRSDVSRVTTCVMKVPFPDFVILLLVKPGEAPPGNV